ncbi:hypothetical protein [Bradyrhizobium jicamae]|uniref:hypothetical protein n=1 Tax=Bradyrhizobium jicamae TaxID=280332 RepID=UPI0012EDC527|nr:hypothetical protein [Bradyrhizobium jicamae]
MFARYETRTPLGLATIPLMWIKVWKHNSEPHRAANNRRTFGGLKMIRLIVAERQELPQPRRTRCKARQTLTLNRADKRKRPSGIMLSVTN